MYKKGMTREQMLGLLAILIITIVFILLWTVFADWIVKNVLGGMDIKTKICELFGATIYDIPTGKTRCR